MELNLISEERYYLEKLSKILNYNFSTSLLFILSFFGGILLAAAVIAMILFTFLLLYVFMKLKKISWIISFGIVVIIPLTISIIIGLEIGYLYAFLLVSLGFYYFYCFTLKYIVNERLNELIAHDELELERKSEKEKMSLWENQFKDKINNDDN